MKMKKMLFDLAVMAPVHISASNENGDGISSLGSDN
jgi:hypothetical protein